ncbi:protein SPT2 homolog [Portunus trituberculatus]|uniref:protein SPT2 homolog n=1 Tax=Portunus trituberculatus TaxID=210409 RepID=UPI001E1CF814|nr:protein SPT2 homolog [Portunus trituberculatus]
MSVDTSWDIESYRASYESDEHWTLKREFLEAHKERIPEARLICLAQAFVNIELLGCKYPDALMRQVEVLARDVGCDFKENKKNMLQRTFVKASDAAGAKVKGTRTSSLLGDCPSFKPSTASEEEDNGSLMSSEPSSDLEGGDSAKRGPMSSLLGLPPTPLSSRLPIMSFVKGSNSSQVGSSSVSDGASTSANPSFGGSLGGSKAAFSGSASAMGFVSGGTLMPNSSKPMLGGGSGSSMGFVSGGTMTANNKPAFSGSGNAMGFVSGGTMTANNKPAFSGSTNAMGFVSGGTLMPNSKPAFSGSAKSMGFVPGGTMTPNNKRAFGGSATGLSSTGFISGGTLNAGNKTSFSGSGTTGFGGSPNTASKLGGGGQSLLGTPNTSMYRSGNTNSLLPLPTDTTTTTTTTLITAPPAPKKKKSKDKDKNKPITENATPVIWCQGWGEGQGFMQPGQSQQQQQQQPSTAAATATPQHNHLANWCKVVGRDNPLAGFVVVRHENHDNGGAAAAILNTSSCFSRMPVNYHYQKKDHFHECTVNINGVDVVTSRALGRKKAREQAVVDAVAELPKHCFTLKIKKNIRAESVTLEQLGEDLANRSSMMDNPNSVASKMMKQMGWTGGGLGKKGEGITEPIRPSEVFGRQGLGHTGNKGAVTPAFRKRVREIVSDYASTSKNMALAFSNDFSKEQRAEIHKIARLCHLKSATRGRDTSSRCLVITRKMPAQDLLLRLLQEGSNDQYELLPPSSSSYDSAYGSAYSSSYSSTSTC